VLYVDEVRRCRADPGKGGLFTMRTYAEPNVLPDHILGAILTLAKKKRSPADRLAFRGHDFNLQLIFRELRQELDAPLLQRFVFSDSGPIPYSPILSESVSKLQLSGLLGRENPDYEVLFLMPAAEKFYDEVLQARFSEEEKRQLDQIADAFLKRIQPL